MKLYNGKDGTAQGVAKARHYEELWPEDQRLFTDIYAKSMYPGAFVQRWLGTGMISWLYNIIGPGVLELLIIRTKWLDDEVMKWSPTMKQMIILGAGYDTRGFRLDLPPKDRFQVWEGDQPEVQAKKVSIMERISLIDDKVVHILMDEYVKFVPVDFNTDSVDEKLKNAGGF
jgi:methyltransferase (TIGR00027 family)